MNTEAQLATEPGQHTPGPWKVGEDLTGGDLPDHNRDIFTQIRSDGSGTVALVDATPIDDPEVNGNAAFIVLACNAHADLLAACKDAAHTARGECPLLDEAIAKAEGRTF